MNPDEISLLIEQSRSLRSTFDAIAGRSARSEYLRVMSAAVANQHVDGAFGSNDDPIVKCCFTAEMIDVLLQITPALARRSGDFCSTAFPDSQLLAAHNWLLSQQRPEGDWGEDLWDTCEVLKALISLGIASDGDAIDRALALLRKAADDNWPAKLHFWSGPGQLGNALEVFGLVGDSYYGNLVANQLLDLQDPVTGQFNGEVDVGRGPIEWHTACAVMGLLSCGMVACDPDRTSKGVAWLKAAQADDGSWCPGQTQVTTYTTRNAVIALVLADGCKSPEARRGTDYLVDRFTKSYPNTSTSETLMAASALARTHPGDLYGSIGFSLLTDTQQVLRSFETATQANQDIISKMQLANATLEQQIADMQVKLAELPNRLVSLEDRLRVTSQSSEDWEHRYEKLDAKLGTYALRMTSNQLTVAGIILAIFGIVLTIILA